MFASRAFSSVRPTRFAPPLNRSCSRPVRKCIMKHAILLALGVAALALSISTVFAAGQSLKTNEQIKQFWLNNEPLGGGSGG